MCASLACLKLPQKAPPALRPSPPSLAGVIPEAPAGLFPTQGSAASASGALVRPSLHMPTAGRRWYLEGGSPVSPAEGAGAHPRRPSRGGVGWFCPSPQGVRLPTWSLASLRPWRRAGWELEGTPGPPRAGAGSACGLLLSWMHGAGNPWLPFPAPVPVRNCARQARDQSRHLAFIGNPPRSVGNQRVWQPLRSPWLPYRSSAEGQFCAEGPVLPLECSVHSSAHL